MKIECTVEELKEIINNTPVEAPTDVKLLLDSKPIFGENHD